MKLFGKAKAAPTKDALQQLNEHVETLHKRKQFLEKKINNETEQAKAYKKAGNTNAALKCLKRKKLLEKQFAAMDGAEDTLQQQIMALEAAQINKDTLNILNVGAKAHKDALGKITVEQVDDVMLNVEESMAVGNEIGDALAQGIGGQQYDQDDLLAELEELMEEDVEQQLLGAEAVPTRLPDVPQTLPKTKAKAKDEDEDELAALQAMMM